MRWLACAWLLVVGCFDPPTGPPYKIKLLSADPPVVSVHGGEWVTIGYTGELPESYAVVVDELVGTVILEDRDAHTFTLSVPAHPDGDVLITVVNIDRDRVVASNGELLSYQRVAGMPHLTTSSSTDDTLGWDLHPELARPCARAGYVYLENIGDDPLTFAAARSTNAEFTIDSAMCDALEYGEACAIGVCFSSTVPGFHAASIIVSTSAGELAASVQGNVTAATAGLDPTFHGGGVVLSSGEESFYGHAIRRPDGNGIVTWSRTRGMALDVAGHEIARDLTGHIGTAPADWVIAIRAGAPGEGFDALVANTNNFAMAILVHLDDSFALVSQTDLPFDSANPYYDLQRAPSGRILAIGSKAVVAIANGVVDTTYGTNGRVVLPGTYNNRSVIDSQGRLYAVVSSSLIRITANGTVDGSFGYGNSLLALTVDSTDRVFVVTGSNVVRLSETGYGELSIPATYADDIAIDASGRIYLVGSGRVYRYSGGTQELIGYDTTYSVVCPSSGACYLLGANMLTVHPFTTTAPSYYEPYVLRLAN
ncbi:MAG TPA: hypothetical protein VMZ53_08165 [Kofleriaceae bacterium]|nr:hypothetical protein [Kofleriaceae bacterium]